jgi:hypothetical protein
MNVRAEVAEGTGSTLFVKVHEFNIEKPVDMKAAMK